MKYKDLNYQRRVLNRLGDMAFKRGGLVAMNQALDKAMNHIWQALEVVYA